MRIKDVIRAQKANVIVSPWHYERMPKNVFPLTKSAKSPRLGAGFDWLTAVFDIGADAFRVLLAVDFAKEQYYAFLGQVRGQDMKMLVSYEFHSTHGGWHVHAGCGDTRLIPVGRYKGPWKRTIPQDVNACRSTSWGIRSHQVALQRMSKQFGVPLGVQQIELEI